MRKVTVGVSAALVLGLIVGARVFLNRMNSGLDAVRRQVSSESKLTFQLLALGKASGAGFELVSPTTRYTTGLSVGDTLYLAGPGGLSIYGSPEGQPTVLRTGLELPPAPIVALASGRLRGESRASVFAATQGEGLLIVNPGGLTTSQQLRPSDPEARDITAVLPLDSGDVLIGTRRGGLLLYDGKTLTVFQPNLAKIAVTALAGNEGDIWIGTRTQGVLHWHAGTLDAIGSAEGLPDPMVEDIAIGPQGVFVGTPLGVAQFNDGRLSRVVGRGLFARSLGLSGDTLMVATIDQGLHEIPLAPHARITASGLEEVHNVSRFFTAGNTLLAVDDKGLLRQEEDASWQKLISSPTTSLADSNVTSLSFSPDGRLWIGYFDRGVDVFDAQTSRADHVEDDHVFCINRIVQDAQRGSVDVATSNGLVLFDAKDAVPRERQVLSKRDGLISDQVTDVAFTRSGLTAATPAGITFFTPAGAQSLYAFEGLVNNHVYTLAAQTGDGRVVAGTLGGISILDDETVRQNVTLKNSALKRNWITAVVRIIDGNKASWVVGTYGGGVVQMDEAGRISTEDNPAPAAVINPNALFETSQHILAGTLDDGLLSYNRVSRHWSHITSGLPSRSVTAFAERNGELYIGTENGIVRIAEARLP